LVGRTHILKARSLKSRTLVTGGSLGKVRRFSVSLEGELLNLFDTYIDRTGYVTRSEAVRDLIRDKLVMQEWKDPRASTVGVITLVYDHHRRELPEKLTHLQHRFYKEIVSTTHIHLDKHNCLEVIIVRGQAKKVQSIADQLISTKGVKHGRLATTTTGRALS
jgi:CopG family nickel-responsive transcriptional regulator